MRKNDFAPFERVIAVIKDEKPVAFCAFTAKDECPEELPYTPFVGFVFVSEEERGQRLSEKMINKAGEYALSLGYERLYICSGH